MSAGSNTQLAKGRAVSKFVRPPRSDIGAYEACLAARFLRASSARFRAQRFFAAAMIRCMPSLLMRRFGAGALVCGAGADGALPAAQRFFCANDIRRRAAALT
jgi:hypothetical protein